MDCCHNRQYALGADNGKLANIPSSEFFPNVTCMCGYLEEYGTHIKLPWCDFRCKAWLQPVSMCNLHFLLFVVCRPITGRDYFEELHIHFISSFLLSVSSAYIYTKKPSFLASYMSEPPLKKGVANPLKKVCMCIGWSIWNSMPAAREGGNKPTLQSRCVAKWSPRQEKTLPESGVQWHCCQNKLYTNMHMETALDSKVTTKNDRIFVV